MKRRLAVLSTGRQDWGILRTLCRLLQEDPAFQLALMLGGMHLSRRFGCARDQVVAEGFTPCEELAWVPEEGPLNPEQQAAAAVRMVAEALGRQEPEALILVGDRFETASAALAATLRRLPIVHLHGGEETEGAMDNALRHAITKLSHLHFTSHSEHTARIVAMGEDPSTVHTVGAPGLDNLHRIDLPDRTTLERELGLPLQQRVVIVTLHPATLGASPAEEVAAVTAAMDEVEATYVITLPNTDPGSEVTRAGLLAAGLKPRRVAVEALGERRYWGLMRVADAILGNSSSAVVEAPAIGLPAVNVGDRQKGRLRGGNLIDAPVDTAAIVQALRQALSTEFRRTAAAAPSPFGDGRASERIMQVLRQWSPPRPPIKRIKP